MFWDTDIFLLDNIVQNKNAYSAWLAGERENIAKKR